jgi:hypothetical protein
MDLSPYFVPWKKHTGFLYFFKNEGDPQKSKFLVSFGSSSLSAMEASNLTVI